jgi:hypothetical protein
MVVPFLREGGFGLLAFSDSLDKPSQGNNRRQGGVLEPDGREIGLPPAVRRRRNGVAQDGRP